MMEELISIPTAAKRLGVSETIVRRLIDRGDLAVARVDQAGQQRRRYFRAGDVESLRQRRAERVES